MSRFFKIFFITLAIFGGFVFVRPAWADVDLKELNNLYSTLSQIQRRGSECNKFEDRGGARVCQCTIHIGLEASDGKPGPGRDFDLRFCPSKLPPVSGDSDFNRQRYSSLMAGALGAVSSAAAKDDLDLYELFHYGEYYAGIELYVNNSDDLPDATKTGCLLKLGDDFKSTYQVSLTSPCAIKYIPPHPNGPDGCQCTASNSQSSEGKAATILDKPFIVSFDAAGTVYGSDEALTRNSNSFDYDRAMAAFFMGKEKNVYVNLLNKRGEIRLSDQFYSSDYDNLLREARSFRICPKAVSVGSYSADCSKPVYVDTAPRCCCTAAVQGGQTKQLTGCKMARGLEYGGGCPRGQTATKPQTDDNGKSACSDTMTEGEVTADAENPGITPEKLLNDAKGLNQLTNFNGPAELVGQGIRVLLSFIGSIALVLYIYAGLLWMTAAGNTERIGTAKQIFVWTSLGLAAMLGSYILIRFLFGTVLSLTV